MYVWHCHDQQTGVNVNTIIFGSTWTTVLKLVHKLATKSIPKHANKGDLTFRTGRADWKSDCFYTYFTVYEFWLVLWGTLINQCLCICGVSHTLLGITRRVSYGSSESVSLNSSFHQRENIRKNGLDAAYEKGVFVFFFFFLVTSMRLCRLKKICKRKKETTRY